MNEMFMLEKPYLKTYFMFTSLTFARVLAPIFVRFLEGRPPLGTDWEIMMIICLSLSALVFQFQAVMFVAIGITTFQRKWFFARMASSLINLNDNPSFKTG